MTNVHGIDVRTLLLRELQGVADDAVGVLLSGGVDSTVVLLALRELGKRVTAYTFHLTGIESSDLKRGRAIAAQLEIPWASIALPDDVETLLTDTRFMIHEMGLRRKADIECTWPMLYAVHAVRERVIATGLCADGHFGISKRAILHCRGSIADLDAFREALFAPARNYSQTFTTGAHARRFGKELLAPYRAESFIQAFRGTSWGAINRPRQKQPIWDAYPDVLARLPVIKHHSNLQLADSGIADHFKKLLSMNIAPRSAKSAVAAYNAIARAGS